MAIVVGVAFVATTVRDSKTVTVDVAAQSEATTSRANEVSFAIVDRTTATSGLYRFDLDTKERSELAAKPGVVYQSVAWGPNGQWLAFTAGSPGSPAEVYRVEHDGTGEQQLSSVDGGHAFRALVSPDGSRVAYSKSYRDGPSRLFLVGSGGGSQQELTAAQGIEVALEFGCSELGPMRVVPQEWSPEGGELLVRASREGCEVEHSSITVISIAEDTSEPVQAARGPNARFSSGDDEIVYETRDGELVLNKRGQSSSRTIGPGYTPTRASADKIGFVRAEDPSVASTYGIWTWSHQQGAQLLIEPGMRVDRPRWTPTGERVVYIGTGSQGPTLWTVRTDSRTLEAITTSDQGAVVDFDVRP